MTTTITIAESLLVNAVRSKGFVAFNAIGGCLLISLSLTGSFSLGRELMMIRESGFGSLFVLPFAASIMACALNAGRKPSAWRTAAVLSCASRNAQVLGFTLHAVAAGVTSFLLLTPFLVSGFCFFHSHHVLGAVCALAGITALAVAAAGPRGSFLLPPSCAAPVLAALLCVFLFRFVPDGRQLALLWLFSVIPVCLACALAGASCAALRGIAGPTVAIGVFLVSNLRSAMGSSGIPAALSGLIPDLAGLNPSLAVSSGVETGLLDIAGAALYSLLIMLAAALAATGAASLSEEPV